MSVLDGKVAFVTGGSRGIGAAIVKGLVAAGAKVAFTYQSQRQAADEVATATGGLALQCEVTDRDSVRAALTDAENQLGAISILVNNAGINNPTDFDQITDKDWDSILGVNLKGPFICS